MEIVLAYTDGACTPNPGIGAWAFTLTWPNGEVTERSHVTEDTTNNREEIKAIIQAIVTWKESQYSHLPLYIYTDSKLAMNCITGEWKRNTNLDLFEISDELMSDKVILGLVKGHAGDPGNERADYLATKAVKVWKRARRANTPNFAY